MVKADLTRDYYGDLELLPNADTAEIKKQFKKLALTYHPDRNPGRENEVTAKFQKIQSAHEVLIDPSERAKYDSNRARPGRANGFTNAYGGQSSGMKGNPWAKAGAEWAPPPKPPTARNRNNPPPPPQPSTGAGRYAKFQPPSASAYQAAQEGPQARKAQYEAWDRTRHQTEHGPGKTWKAPQPPPRNTPTSGHEESNAQKHGAPPSSRPGFSEFRDPSARERSQSTNAASRKGYMPNMSGGDEPAAPRGAYSTQRPDPPPRQQPPPPPPEPSTRPTTVPRTDPLKKFRMEANAEERVSTPYATHGGEKFNPFESAAAGMYRSTSTRERNEAFDSVPKADSDTDLKPKNRAPHRARSFATPSSHAPRPSYSESVDLDESSDDGVQMPAPPSRPSRRSNGATKPAEPSTMNFDNGSTSKQTGQISRFRQWMNENPGKEPPPNGFGADGPPLRSQPTTKANGEPSMYANPTSSTPSQSTRSKRHTTSYYSVKELEDRAKKLEDQSESDWFFPTRNGDNSPNQPAAVSEELPSGVHRSTSSLSAFEEMQRSYIDRLLSNKRQGTVEPQKTSNCEAPRTDTGSQQSGLKNDGADAWNKYRDSAAQPGSPAKKLKPLAPIQKHFPYSFSACRSYWDELRTRKADANERNASFSFNLSDDAFARPSAKANGFSNSSENISTKFTPEDWDGKFAAGGNYFQPEKVPSTPQRTRSQSSSRARGRSPIKIPPTFGMPARSEEQTPVESPGGTKFSAQDWAETFKPQTFAPRPMPNRSTPNRKRSIRTTLGGNAAVIDESDTSDEKPLFKGRKSVSPAKRSPPADVASPDPMDVDTPPANHHTVPIFAAPKVNGKLNTDTTKRPATSASTSPVDSELKVAFEDLKVKDIISTLDMPAPPSAPSPPASDADVPTRAAYNDYVHRFEKYMQEWDRFNSKFLLHMVARKNQNDDLKDKRWNDDRGLETYRMGLKEDQAVMFKWAEHTSAHEGVVKCFVIMKERMKNSDVKDSVRRSRKKTH